MAERNTKEYLAPCSPFAVNAITAANNYTNNGKDDWYLPSISDLIVMSTNLTQAGVSGFDSGEYWSSSFIGMNTQILSYNFATQSRAVRST